MEGTDFTPLRGFPRIYFTLPDTRTPHAGFGAVAVRWPAAVLWQLQLLVPSLFADLFASLL